ncbi:hypothetical protein TSAR_008213 [Trichomalopsis sarcophagae]|uniref:Uncharacterized protein n=1 Tax=Trichomalopsis sarcophagae TaxID=543379 RepID=A0A232ERS1_9HYME|nr:hypothetical protein TSAR_008213 [Trichomalopsis sarcophagae]
MAFMAHTYVASSENTLSFPRSIWSNSPPRRFGHMAECYNYRLRR